MFEVLKNYSWELLLGLNYLIAVITAISIILSNVNPTKTLSYLILLLAFPFVGIVIYYLFGQEYRKSKIFERKNVLNQHRIKEWKNSLFLDSDIIQRIEDNLLEDKIRLVKLLFRSERSPLTIHNRVKVLLNGEQKFKALFEDIDKAEKTIHLEYYIIEDDIIGGQLIDLICKKSKDGVKVRLSYDYVGSKLTSRAYKKLKEAGVTYHPFMPVYFPKFTSKLNYRNHRKIAVIDGKVGYVGGINVTDRYVNIPGSDRYWRDTHLRIEGEAVGSLQLHFLLNWDFLTDYDLVIEDHFFPKPEINDKALVQIAASGPDSDWASIMEAIFTAINTADKSIYITTPYFIPNDEVKTAITSAARSGVEVKLILPEKGDSWAAQYAGFSFVEEMLESGVRVYLYTKGFVHAKTMVVDDVFATVGTSNMDYRSFNINFEINALVYDRAITKELSEVFNEDLKSCRELTLDSWRNRSKVQKIKESFNRLWAPIL
ncbi:cardiolipin synthase [Zhouia amylolytica]|uniref:Cardiolipin synthase n=1 Tax=Zhouia amylolytica TaxID=376730 RepID=A0A1I6QIG8_9FLAO|nr:cardiolipin synthase [Zhouia amylolytica]MCQ0111248.1 cardiolipin synthase [Zhouia amylolytica]SFS52297.1 cardiolipin synthase [Zhouia amylolytica]